MLICRSCHRTFKGNTKDSQCPISRCEGTLVDIDKSFVSICTKLWDKGYDTQFCCESHFTSNEVVSPYLVFTIPMNDKLIENNPDIKDFIGYRYEYSAAEGANYYKYKEPVSKEEENKLSAILGQLVSYLKIQDLCDKFRMLDVQSSEDELKVLAYTTPPMLVDGNYEAELCDDSLDDYEKFLNNKKKSLEPFHKLAKCIIPVNYMSADEFIPSNLLSSGTRKCYDHAVPLKDPTLQIINEKEN